MSPPWVSVDRAGLTPDRPGAGWSRRPRAGGARNGGSGRTRNHAWRSGLLNPARALAIAFGLAIAGGTVLLALPIATADGRGLGLIDAFFTATSATCVTGLTVINIGATLTTFGELVVLTLIQIGGLGVMTVTTIFAFALRRRISLRDSLTVGEALGESHLSAVGSLTRSVIEVTMAVEFAGALLLGLLFCRFYPPGTAFYYGLFHSVSAFCNAGFDLFGDSLVRFVTDVPVNLVMMTLIVLGGLGFIVMSEFLATRYGRMFSRRPRDREDADGVVEHTAAPAAARRFLPARLSLHTRVVVTTTVVLIGVGTLLVLAFEWSNPVTLGPLSPGHKVMAALFQAITPRTAGFNTIPTGGLLRPVLLILMVLMFIGAAPGSTGGGVKVTTFAVALASVRSALRRRDDVELGGRRLPPEVPAKAWVIIALAVVSILVVMTLLLATEKEPFLDVAFETFSAFGTVGLSTGLTPRLSTIGRVVLPVLMYAGRLGPLTLAVALARRKPGGADWRLPEERVVVG
ncbi:MAG: Trk family potassium uptake protein [Bacillota bacterium]|nr:MAG: Trk family potassium uptake protein [Bacillota bacterium]